MPLRAEVQKLDALSGHADREELLTWMQPIAAGLKKVFLVHGEPDQQTALAAAIHQRYRSGGDCSRARRNYINERPRRLFGAGWYCSKGERY
jgi:predicted metal-dependent RNase